MKTLLRQLIRDLIKQSSPSIEVVKYKDMPSRDWYYSPHHTDWYYHVPRSFPPNPSPKILDATLDDCLKPLATILNEKGFVTHPSCQGHYRSPRFFNRVYNNLMLDAGEIRKKGLQLINCETGETFHHQDSKWELPWDKATFASIAGGTNNIPEGYLSFSLPSGSYPLAAKLASLVNATSGCRSGYDDKSFTIRVYTGNPRSQCKTWSRLTDVLTPIIKKNQ